MDFRSDTVTRPTAAMREAMLNAPVGDDVYGEDPTVNALEEKAAAMLGFESAVYGISGTQTNLLGLLAHCERGHARISPAALPQRSVGAHPNQGRRRAAPAEFWPAAKRLLAS